MRLLAAVRSDTCFLLATEYIHGAPLDAVINSDRYIVKVFLLLLFQLPAVDMIKCLTAHFFKEISKVHLNY